MPTSTEAPWLKFYGDIPPSLDYPEISLYEALMRTVARTPDAPAYDFFGTVVSYRALSEQIDHCANGLAALGLGPGERVTIALPTCPQAVICFYALNKLGAVASMIHPLSTESEIAFYLTVSESRFALTLDAFYAKFESIFAKTNLEKLILARIPDYLGWLKRMGFWLTKGRKIAAVPGDPMVMWWQDLVAPTSTPVPATPAGFKDLAVILYSGGTTGRPKGIMLSNQNFISEGMQVSAWGGLAAGDAILAILPVFHGFGLGVCINAAFMGGAKSILVPQFTPEIVAKLIHTQKPNVVVGVPTLFEALTRDKRFCGTDLSCIKAAFCGADTLPRTVKERFEAIVRRQGGQTQLREGFGLTEAVTAIMAMPLDEYREGSIGVPFPDMAAKIVATGTTEELPPCQEGEICISGPAVMMGYLNQPEETAQTLRTHADGKVWLHTGDIGTMDTDGFFYFCLRAKRMIKSSGMNVYPAQVESQLYKHPEVREACVVGIPDERQGERVKAFVVPKEWRKADEALAQDLIAWCRRDLIKWSCPREIAFRKELPQTLVGKVAFNDLVEAEIKALRAAGKYAGPDACTPCAHCGGSHDAAGCGQARPVPKGEPVS